MRKILLLLLIAVAVSYAQYLSFENLFWQYSSIAIILLTLSILLTGSVYMLGIFLSNEKIKMWGKTEVVEIFYSGVIFAIILSIYFTANQLGGSLVRSFDPLSANIVCNQNIPLFNFKNEMGEDIDYGYAALPCHMRVAKNFLATLFYETAGLVKSVGVTYSWYTFLSSWFFDFTPVGTTTFFSGASFSLGIFAFLNTKVNALEFLFDTGVKSLIIIRFQEILLNIIAIALFPLLLTAGLILRTFVLTRRLGGLLIAMALSLYFIYPIFYIVGDMVLNAVKVANNNQNLPLNQQPALVRVFTDFSALPPKLNSSYAEDPTNVKTDGTQISGSILDQIANITSTQICNDALNEVQGQDVAHKDPTAQGGIFDKFGTKNYLLGSWLSDAFSKGGVWNPGSFKSILVGIDALAKSIFFSLFFSFLSIFATISAIKVLSPMLGGDVEIAGLTHLI